MEETIVEVKPSQAKGKKYTAIVKSKAGRRRKIHFGAKEYEQYRDALGHFKKLNHGDSKRRKSYFKRFSGVETKAEAMKREMKKANGRYTAKILSHKFLW